MSIIDGEDSTPLSLNNNGPSNGPKKTHHQMEEKSNVFVSIASGWGKVS
jgi:hypothetical protein